MTDAPDAKPLINLGGSVTLLNVGFSYPDGERVLRDLTLHIPAGKRLVSSAAREPARGRFSLCCSGSTIPSAAMC